MKRWLPLACGTGLLCLALKTGAETASNQAVTPLPLREAVTTKIELPAAATAGLILHVAPGGDDQGDGTTGRAFASLERARDEIRAIRQKGALPKGGVTVQVRGGEYGVSKTLNLTSEDSGKEGDPVRYCAAPGEKVLFRGGVRLSGWRQLTDPNLYPLLPGQSMGKVWYLEMKSAGITNPMPLKPGDPLFSQPGFEKIPVEEMGTYADTWRKMK